MKKKNTIITLEFMSVAAKAGKEGKQVLTNQIKKVSPELGLPPNELSDLLENSND